MRRALLLLFFAFPLHATLMSSAITGRVVAGDTPAEGVTVTATSDVLQHPRTTVTGPRGTYWLAALPPGQYDVTFAKTGMTTLTRRADVELGRVARADARLEPSADEESVTSTATQPGVTDTTAITSHFDDATLDRLPGREYAANIAPDTYYGASADVDGGAPFLSGVPVAEDVIEQVTVIRGATPVEHEAYGGRVYAVRTRSGREDFFLSLRDTISNRDWNDGGPFLPADDGLQNLFEANGGGRIVSQRLWFFGAFWAGGDATRYSRDERGVMLKLHGQAGPSHHVDATYANGDTTSYTSAQSWSASLRHTGVFGPRVTTETLVSRARTELSFPPLPGGPGGVAQRADSLSTRGTFVLPGDHVLTAGASTFQAGSFDAHAFFLGDRWSVSRFVVNTGVRYTEGPFGGDHILPRVAMTYDLRGDGRRAIAASYGEYEFSFASVSSTRVAALGYAAAIGSSGLARVDLLRRSNHFGSDGWSLQLDARYRLFDRFEAGATYTYTRTEEENELVTVLGPRHDANAWIGAQVPVGGHEFGVTLLQHYTDLRAYDPGRGVVDDRYAPTDVALRYAISLSRVGLTFAADVTNAFGIDEQAVARTVRFWTRLRL